MQLTRHTADGVVFYASPQLTNLDIPHAFSTRVGGVSRPPFDSMNLGNPNGCAVRDDTAHIAENYRRLQLAAGCGGWPRNFVHQVHGPVVAVVDAADFSTDQKADAIVTTRPGACLSIRVADCCPVLIAGPGGVAAVHAGWRGAVGGVIPAAVATLCRAANLKPSQVTAAVGPCIGFDAFEVGPEVLAAFEHTFNAPALVRRRSDGKGTVDLAGACGLALTTAGVPADRIDTTDCCTHRDAGEFFSHRRDRGVTGRMAAVIGFRPRETEGVSPQM